MAMLAEPRRKQRWSLNPRGKQWSEDTNKFGQRMLEKMGWSSGKGLGANEQGITEHVRVSFKEDLGGIGFKKNDMDDAWTEHQDNFNDFLQKLQQDENHDVVQIEVNKGDLSGKSLELKSKQSRARVHYQKFTRGKDVNKYSSKDLANIFGQKELNPNKNNKDKEDNQNASDVIGTQDNRGGVITINAGTMDDYFTRKGRAFSLTHTNKKQQEKDSESEPEYVGFGFASKLGKVDSHDNEKSKENKNVCNYAFVNPYVELDSPEHVLNSRSESKSSRKRKSLDNNELRLSNKDKKFKEENVNESGCKNGIVNPALNLESQVIEICNGKEFEVSRVEFGVANSALDLSDEAKDKKRVTFNDHVEYSTDSVKKKKGTLDKFEVENKKAKKKKKPVSFEKSMSLDFVNEALDVGEISEEINDNEINERKSTKSKKRKESRRSNLETIVEMPEEDKVCENKTESKQGTVEDKCIPNECIFQDVSSTKKRKKKHKERIEEAVSKDKDIKESVKNEILEANTLLERKECETQIVQENQDISKKKKKKKKNKDTELNLEKDENIISACKINDNLENVEEKLEIETVKMKKKSKKDNIHDIGATINTMDEKENANKNNKNNVDESELSKPKKKEHMKLKHESTVNNVDFTHDTEFTNGLNNRVRNKHRSNRFNNRRPNASSPWDRRARMSKRLLTSLFHRDSVLNFPGSNMNEIKGYGADVQ